MDGVIAMTSLGLQRFLCMDETPPTDYDWCEDLVDWAKLDVGFWANLPVYHETLDLLKGLNDVKIVTHCFSLAAIVGKRLWLNKHWPGIEMINLAEKWLLAAPDRYLWDDYPEQIDAWIRAGGVGGLVDRPWNQGVICVKWRRTNQPEIYAALNVAKTGA